MDAAYLFPGQGAQYVGMGEDLYRRSPAARKIFDLGNELLNFDLSALIFKGPVEELTKTINCQTAIFTTSLACLEALRAEHLDIQVKFSAGLSLGEYSALAAAGALSFADGLQLVRLRAEYMEEAARTNPGGMASVIGLALPAVEEICAQSGAEVANLNCPGQIVISGSVSALKKAETLAKAGGAKKVIPLKVSGAFHSSLMAQAAEKLAQVLSKVDIQPPQTTVISNVTAKAESAPGEIRDNLIRQITWRVLWEDSVKFMSAGGVGDFLEIGPGKILNGLSRKINPALKVYNLETMLDVEKFREERRQCS